MRFGAVRVALLSVLLVVVVITLPGFAAWCRAGQAAPSLEQPAGGKDRLALGRRMYREGILPSGESMVALVLGDIPVRGEQVMCGTCHRRSGMGSSEGQQVIPAVTGTMLYRPLRLPTSKPPLAPELRPAYTDGRLRLAIRDGIDASGQALDPPMPRYRLSDHDLDILIDYLKTLSAAPSPGVTDQDIHFATIVADSVPAATRKAFLDVMRTFFAQKNAETRYESKRAAKAPWHKAWLFEPYRKWVLDVWELRGPGETWPDQLEALYREQPAFAVLGGVALGDWRPVHEFCERTRLPCLFPTTDLPVVSGQDFYSLYLSRGMTLEAEAIASHLRDEELERKPWVQVYPGNDTRASTAAEVLGRAGKAQGADIRAFQLPASGPGAVPWGEMLSAARGGVLILWLSAAEIDPLWPLLDGVDGPARIYLSTTLYDEAFTAIPLEARERVYFVHPHELPGRLSRLLARSTGWLRFKKIYAPEARQVQANAYFALKVAGDALTHIRGYFFRDYFIERIEDMVDNAIYTSVYPRISLAPGQRFVSKGCYITRVSGTAPGGLEAVTKWKVPQESAQKQ